MRAAPGFFTSWEKFPNEVTEKRYSIFRIFVLSPRIEYLVTPDKLELYKNYVNSTFAGEALLWKQLEIGDPNPNGIIEVRAKVSTGTAFLYRNGSTLLTARHSFTDIPALPTAFFKAKDAEEASAALENFSPEVLVLNYKNEIVFDSRRNKAIVTVGFHGHPSHADLISNDLANFDRGTKLEATDLIELKLERDLNGPLSNLRQKNRTLVTMCL